MYVLTVTTNILTVDPPDVQFSTFVATIEALLEQSRDTLEQSKQLCSSHTITGHSDDEPLFDGEQLQKINACTTFEALFTILCKHWSWEDYSILTRIIATSGLKEADDELELFKRKMASHKEMKIMSKNVSPEG